LLKSFDKYCRDDNPDDVTNFVIKKKCNERYNYKLMPKECWDILSAKYGGIEIKR
jgi:hypothetical protein